MERRPQKLGWISKPTGEDTESHFQGQRASQIFLMALLKEGRMRKDGVMMGNRENTDIKRIQGKVKWLERGKDKGRTVKLLQMDKSHLELMWLQ